MNRRDFREPEIPIAQDAGIFPGWLLTPGIRFANRNPANRPPEEIRARIREAIELEFPADEGHGELDLAGAETAWLDCMVHHARSYALSMTRREAWRAAKDDSPDRLRQDNEAWREEWTETREAIRHVKKLLEIEEALAPESPEKAFFTMVDLKTRQKHRDELREYGAKLETRAEMLALHAPETARAIKAIREARAALEALPAEARELLNRELDGFQIEGEGGILEGLAATLRILDMGKQQTGRGRPNESVKDFVAGFCVAAFGLLGDIPTQRQLNRLLQIFVNDPERPDRYLPTVKIMLAEWRKLQPAKADHAPQS